MELNERPGATDTGLQRVLSQDEWNELHDSLVLALDALGDRPADVDYSYLVNCMIHQRLALRGQGRRGRSPEASTTWP